MAKNNTNNNNTSNNNNGEEQTNSKRTKGARKKTKNNSDGYYFCGKYLLLAVVLPAVVGVLISAGFFLFSNGDVLKGHSNHMVLGWLGMQAAVTGFCFGGDELFSKLSAEGRKGDSHADPSITDGEVIDDFIKTGEIREEDYDKASIYAILYGVYSAVGKVKHTNGELYEFSFNTWGISNVDDKPYGPDEPQRHGKAAYNALSSSFEDVREYIESKPPRSVTFAEIGCGTGAGANLITKEVWPTQTKVYNALDMQMGGIEKCKRLNNPLLNCVHGNGRSLPFEDESVDVVIINEAHIAEIEIGDEEKTIFNEIKRILKKDGFFLWGNAIPTKVWNDGTNYLTTEMPFESCGSFNHTDSAILARQQDTARVRLYLNQVYDTFPIFWPSVQQVLGSTQRCRDVTDALIRNFFRDVDTDLYNRMVTRDDSYMHKCFRIHE